MCSLCTSVDGGKGSWEKAWRACAVRAQRMRVASPETPAQSRAGFQFDLFCFSSSYGLLVLFLSCFLHFLAKYQKLHFQGRQKPRSWVTPAAKRVQRQNP